MPIDASTRYRQGGDGRCGRRHRLETFRSLAKGLVVRQTRRLSVAVNAVAARVERGDSAALQKVFTAESQGRSQMACYRTRKTSRVPLAARILAETTRDPPLAVQGRRGAGLSGGNRRVPGGAGRFSCQVDSFVCTFEEGRLGDVSHSKAAAWWVFPNEGSPATREFVRASRLLPALTTSGRRPRSARPEFPLGTP